MNRTIYIIETVSTKTFNCYPLVNDQNTLVKYQTKDKLHNQNMKWENVVFAITKTAEEVLRCNTKHGKNLNHGDEIEKMSKQQKELASM